MVKHYDGRWSASDFGDNSCGTDEAKRPMTRLFAACAECGEIKLCASHGRWCCVGGMCDRTAQTSNCGRRGLALQYLTKHSRRQCRVAHPSGLAVGSTTTRLHADARPSPLPPHIPRMICDSLRLCKQSPIGRFGFTSIRTRIHLFTRGPAPHTRLRIFANTHQAVV